MFNSIVLHNPQAVGCTFDLGILAEALVFYRRVRVMANPAELISLLRICGPESFCAAMESGFIELAYVQNHLGVATINAGHANERHGVVFVESSSQKLEEFVYDKLLTWNNNRRKTRDLTNRIVQHAKPIRWDAVAVQAARTDILDPAFCNACAITALPYLAPGYVPPANSYFRVQQESESAIQQPGFTMNLSVQTNFDFDQANMLYRRVVPDAQFGNANVLNGLLTGLSDLNTAASSSDEMAVSPSAAAISGLKLSSLMSRQQSDQKIEAFQEWTCEHGRAIREAVQAKRYNFDDIVHLAEEAAQFKEWLAEHPDTSDLNKEYLKAVCDVGWAEKLPPKVLRFLLFTSVAGALSLVTSPAGGLMAGAALNTLDYFLVDRLVKGWKPNQFVEGPLKTFVQ